jgi:hypothetical protein
MYKVSLRKSLPRLWWTRVKNNGAVKGKSLKMQLFFYMFGTYVVFVLCLEHTVLHTNNCLLTQNFYHFCCTTVSH